MKTREQTKASIRRKSAAILQERKRARRTVFAAACLVLAMAVSGALARLRSRTHAVSEKGVDVSEGIGTFGGATDGGLTGGEDCEDDQLTGDATRRGYDIELYTGFNQNYQQADSMTIFAKPENKTVSLSAENADEKAAIDAMGAWLSGVETQPAAEQKDSGTLYVIERHFGKNVTKAYVRGRQIRFDEGEWLTFSQDEREAFDRLIQDIFNEAE